VLKGTIEVTKELLPAELSLEVKEGNNILAHKEIKISGEIKEGRQVEKVKRFIFTPASILEKAVLREKPWKVYTLPYLFFAPKWAVIPETFKYVTGALTPEGEKAWRNYCREVGRAYSENYPDRKEDIYQITWEPVYPWGFKGTDEQLIKIYEIAYKALHEVDPKAVVIGPTGAGITIRDLKWNANLFRKGLGKYLDGFSIHPYFSIHPERDGLIKNIRDLKEMIYHYTGKHLPMFGTEQGYTTKGNPAKELIQAQGLIRQNLIMLGEGFRFNFVFYIEDYPGVGQGYGYYI
jgi:hypothetical protein